MKASINAHLVLGVDKDQAAFVCNPLPQPEQLKCGVG